MVCENIRNLNGEFWDSTVLATVLEAIMERTSPLQAVTVRVEEAE